MRMHWIMGLSVFGLILGASLMSRPSASALAPASGSYESSMTRVLLSANAKELPVQSFDAF